MADDRIKGFAELERNLEKLDFQTSRKALTNALSRSTTAVVREMKARAPVGKEPHRTYKRRLVPPGFGRRSITKSTRLNRRTGMVETIIGVKPEAFYLIQFFDQRPGRTPYTVRKRRVSGKRGSRKAVQIQPYTLRATPWFSRVFINHEQNMVDSLRRILATNIEKALR